ncbi:MAG: type II secretion system GspH family protein, partial [Clostridiales bacterium]|nr:type II secretion system GspH family protein [Clostridiales bacterium]
MALIHAQRGRRAGFTLIELLVVIGLIAVLATISVAGYSAASRGMADRGVIQNTVSTLRIAQQVCEIDRIPTKVLFFNQRLTDDANQSDSLLYQGTAIAIKQAGRITVNPSQADQLLIDEFADWHQSYAMSGSESAPGMRIYRMRPGEDENKDLDQCSVLVQPFVTPYQLRDYMIQSGTTIDQWSNVHRRTGPDNKPVGASASYVNNGNNYVWGFKASSSGSSGGLSTSQWKVGDAYGV